MRLLVDFDGTISDNSNFPEIGEPKEGVIEALKKLKEAGLTTANPKSTKTYKRI